MQRLVARSIARLMRPFTLLHPTHTQSSVLPIVNEYVKERDVFGQNKISIFHLPDLFIT
jgi:hypothetical protein